ncbi:shikimate dehydrogenase, partial [Streptomyces sp. DSM 41528]|nr:shikimate dehydrogenase [Streptomyces sp. DSM 41528]
AGATASSALAALAVICAGPVTAYVRSRERGDEMRGWGQRLGVDVRVADWAEGARALTAPLVIATTPAGTTDVVATDVPEHPGILFEVLSEPWPTALASAWSARGGGVVGGLDLLVHQGLLLVERMTGRVPGPLGAMRLAGEAALAAR